MPSLTLHMGTAPLAGKFIAPGGSDTSGDGSAGNPWASLSKAFAEAVAGDTVYCRGGTYNSTANCGISVSSAGTSGSPITIAAYPSETPVFSGAGLSPSGNYCILYVSGAAYHVLDGLTFRGWNWPNSRGGNGSAIIDWAGNTQGDLHHFTVQNCTIEQEALTTFPYSHADHCVYIGRCVDYVTVQDCTIKGQGSTSGFGGCIHVYHDPGSRHSVFQRNNLTNGYWGVLIWDGALQGTDWQVLNNTFSGHDSNIRAAFGDSILIRGNSGSHGASGDIVRDSPTSQTPNFTADTNTWT